MYPFKKQGEFSASGLPAWVTALNVSIRTSDPTWIDAYTPYWQAVGEVIEKYQITHEGPVIAVQMENGKSLTFIPHGVNSNVP